MANHPPCPKSPNSKITKHRNWSDSWTQAKFSLCLVLRSLSGSVYIGEAGTRLLTWFLNTDESNIWIRSGIRWIRLPVYPVSGIRPFSLSVHPKMLLRYFVSDMWFMLFLFFRCNLFIIFWVGRSCDKHVFRIRKNTWQGQN